MQNMMKQVRDAGKNGSGPAELENKTVIAESGGEWLRYCKRTTANCKNTNRERIN